MPSAWRLVPHVEEVVAGLKAQPVLFERSVLALADAFGHGVEFFEGFVLEAVAQPCRDVACFVGVSIWGALQRVRPRA